MGCCSSKHKDSTTVGRPIYAYEPLSRPLSDIKQEYNVCVVGSGYGGSVAACRASQAGQSVCLLERGKEWLPGQFPENIDKVLEELYLENTSMKKTEGKKTGLYHLTAGEDITFLHGCGLGGGSLINDGVMMDGKAKVFYDNAWPQAFREDLDNFNGIDKQRAASMLCPQVADSPLLSRSKQLGACLKDLKSFEAEEIEGTFSHPPLAITMRDTPRNKWGVSQAACNGCGNCLTGCNVGAKNTTSMNYLAEAHRNGAHLFCCTEVTAITWSGKWFVWYRRHDSKDPNQQYSLSADTVILAAGVFGTVRILLNSRLNGLDVSPVLGKKLSANGSYVGVCTDANRPSNGFGLRTGMFSTPKSSSSAPPGPTVCGCIDLRKRRDALLLYEVACPGAVAAPFQVSASIATGKLGSSQDPFPSNGQWVNMAKSLNADAVSRIHSFLCLTNDECQGEISLHTERPDLLHISWSASQYKKHTFSSKKLLEELSASLGGSLVTSMKFPAEFCTKAFSVMPLGGCPMGGSGSCSVVNHRGAVFIGESDDAFEGLYVVGSTTIPRAVGVSPWLTITVLAERFMRLLAQEKRWTIRY